MERVCNGVWNWPVRGTTNAGFVSLFWNICAWGTNRVSNVVVTQGGAGALIVGEDGVRHLSGIPVDVVDSTGAGDAFNAALGVALVEGNPLAEAVRFATVAGALTCTKLGVIPALPYRKEIEALMQR